MILFERGGGGVRGWYIVFFVYFKYVFIFLIVVKFNGCLLNDYIFFIKRFILILGFWFLYQEFNNFDFSFQIYFN